MVLCFNANFSNSEAGHLYFPVSKIPPPFLCQAPSPEFLQQLQAAGPGLAGQGPPLTASASRLCVASASASPVGVAGSSCQERGGDARRLGVVHFLQVAQRSSCRGPEWRLLCRGRDPQRASCPGLQQGLGTLDPFSCTPLAVFPVGVSDSAAEPAAVRHVSPCSPSSAPWPSRGAAEAGSHARRVFSGRCEF